MRSGRRMAGAAVAAVLGGMLAGPPVAAQPAALPPLVTTDDFSDPTTGWTVREEDTYRMGYVDGTYQVTSTGPTPLLLGSTGEGVGNGLVQVELTDVPGSAPHPHGVFVRAQDGGNFYGFAVASDGSFMVFHFEDGALVTDHEEAAGFLADGLYRTDGPNLVWVWLSGTELRFELNNTELYAVTDALWPDGVAGVLAASSYDLPAGTVFDNWRLEAFVN